MKVGPQNWFEQQLNPASIPDPVVDKRMQDYPALTLTPALTVSNFPTNQILRQISEGKQSMPKDPTTPSVYQVLEAKYTRQQQEKKDEADEQAHAGSDRSPKGRAEEAGPGRRPQRR